MSTINQKFYLVCVRPKTLFGHTPYSPTSSSSYCLSPKMARDITCVKAWHHLQPQQFLPPPTCSPDRGRCHHCVRVDAAAVAIIMSNILLDAVARLQLELPQSLAVHSALNHVAKLFANMLRIRLPDANTNRKREANIFQFDFHLHLEFFLHENYFRLAVIYRILLRRNASCRTSTATVAATFVSLTAMQSLHQFIDQLDGVRSVCARGLLNKWTALCPIWALAQSLQNVRRAVSQGEHQICRTSVSQIKSPAN